MYTACIRNHLTHTQISETTNTSGSSNLPFIDDQNSNIIMFNFLYSSIMTAMIWMIRMYCDSVSMMNESRHKHARTTLDIHVFTKIRCNFFHQCKLAQMGLQIKQCNEKPWGLGRIELHDSFKSPAICKLFVPQMNWFSSSKTNCKVSLRTVSKT